MSSGRLQLASVGIQDQFLTGDPEITYFKQIYKQHTNFALQLLENTFQEIVGWGQELNCIIDRKGDLIRNIYLKIQLPEIKSSNSYGYTNTIGNALIEYADLVIGGQLIERLTGESIEIHNQLFISDSQQRGLDELIGKTSTLTGLGVADSANNFPRTLMVPLPFYFSSSPSLSIPLCSITKQEVEIRVKLKNIDEVVTSVDKTIGLFPSSAYVNPINSTLLVEYIFLDQMEIDFFKNLQNDYLITQTQLAKTITHIKDGSPIQYRLNFSNPVKEMNIVIQSSNIVGPESLGPQYGNDWFNFSNQENTGNYPKYHQLKSLQLDFNGQTIIQSEIAEANFLFSLQNMLNHTRVPTNESNCFIYTYSFALNPENHLPTGTVNMSRIQNQLITLKLTDYTLGARTIHIYAKSYNVLRIQDGLAGLLFIDSGVI